MKLPRLPNPAVSKNNHQYMPWGSLYTADQMKAYAKKAVLEEREACAKLCEDAPEPDGGDLADRIRARGNA